MKGVWYTDEGTNLCYSLNRKEQFDARFFSISEEEARFMDPCARRVLEVVWQALEHSNILPLSLESSKTGVFIGVNESGYSSQLIKNECHVGNYFATGNSASMIAGRISHIFDFTGPCMALDTACSSSLTAIQTACTSLRSKQCKLALAGGINMILNPWSNDALSNMGALSPDGKCRVFASDADG